MSIKIKKIDTGLKKLAENMISTMKSAQGIGLAAPQVGKNICLIVMKYHLDEKRVAHIALINPEIIKKSTKNNIKEEGCLSLPDKWAKVARPDWIEVKFIDLNKNQQIWKLENLNARIALHEIDHLHGILFTDRILVASN